MPRRGRGTPVVNTKEILSQHNVLLCPDGGIGIPACRQAGAHRSVMIYYVYAISSKRRKYIYVGLSDDWMKRIQKHNDGKERTPRAYRPFNALLVEKYPSRVLARKREKYLKSGVGKEFLNARRLFSTL